MGKRENGKTGKWDIDELVTKVIGCCIEVHKALGPGFLESLYHRALEIELAANSLPFETQKPIRISYRDHFVGEHRLDLLIDDQLVVELKTVEHITRDHYAQLKSYMNAVNQQIGLLVNFAGSTVNVRRVELNKAPSPVPPFSRSPHITQLKD